MSAELPNCWEIKKCGREKGGSKISESGECPASKEGLGHSCWVIAGTFCEGVVQGTVAQKLVSCMECDVCKRYDRLLGPEGKEIAKKFPYEEAKYIVVQANLASYRKQYNYKNNT